MNANFVVNTLYSEKPFKTIFAGQTIHVMPSIILAGQDESFLTVVDLKVYENGIDQEPTLEGHLKMSRKENPLRMWRAIQLLKLVPDIEECGNCTRCASEIGLDPQTIDCFLTKTNIGQEAFEKVMKAQAPEEILSLISQFYEARVLDADSLTDELEAGTLDWDDIFADYGILHPEQREILKMNRLNILMQYMEIFQKYQKDIRIHIGDARIQIAEDVLLALVERNVAQEYDKVIICAAAFAISEKKLLDEITTSNESEDQIFLFVINQGSRWISKKRHPIFWWFFQKQYRETLEHILKNWGNWEIKTPLIPSLEELDIT